MKSDISECGDLKKKSPLISWAQTFECGLSSLEVPFGED